MKMETWRFQLLKCFSDHVFVQWIIELNVQTRHLGLYVEKVADLDLYSYALHCDRLATYRFLVSGDLSARYSNFYANIFVQLLCV